ncbi:MAG: hypothetical protein WA821_01680 [Anaerolineales bacterium]
MNPILITGTIIVTGALIAYSIFIFAKQRQCVLTRFVLTALTLGLVLDITATAVMMIGSRNIPITPHGVLGYSALAGMLVDTLLIWRHWRSAKKHEPISKNLQAYTWLAYGWWVLAYVAGGLLAAFALR